MAPAIFTLSSSHFPTALGGPSFSSTRFRINTTKLKHKQLYVHTLSLSFFQSSTGCPQRVEQCNAAVRTVSRAVMWAIFCLAVGFPPVFALPACAVVSPASEVAVNKETKRHEYSEYTRSLLEEVSCLMKCVEEVKKGNGGMVGLESGLRAVKAKKEGLKRELVDELRRKEKKMNVERERLEKQAEDIEDRCNLARNEKGRFWGSVGKSSMEKVEERKMSSLKDEEDEYEKIWNRIDEIQDEISRKKSAVSIGVQELSYVERECEELVKKFRDDMRQKKSSPAGFVPKLSRADIEKELESAQRRFLEEMFLPKVVEDDGAGSILDQDCLESATRIKQCLEDSRKLQKDVVSHTRREMKRFCDEKKVIFNTPQNKVLKGYPELESKWIFGDKEVVIPTTIRNHFYHGWDKWQEDLKRRLLEGAEHGKQYVAEKQEHILLDRDRVISQTWYNEGKSRWEISPTASSYAVSRKLVDRARIRPDWRAVYLKLKGEDTEYFLNVEEFNMIYEEFGGFDGLYKKMLADGIPTAVQLMPIPFFELNLWQQFLFIRTLAYHWSSALWNDKSVSLWRVLACKEFKILNEEIMALVLFPLVEFILPYPVKEWFGISGYDETSSIYLKWEERTNMGLLSQLFWNFWVLIRIMICGYAFFQVFRFLARKIPRIPGSGPLVTDPSIRIKRKRLKAYILHKKRIIGGRKKAGIDPVGTAFDHMKRVKNPPIPLKDFASIEYMREEINEVVVFLQNPGAFQELGARAPRGVLIVGGRGSGKTSLALAIAAEAKVPVVDIKAKQLEAGLWVGQGASNVRELFQTARDLAPVIIFVEDFDLFAGVRGNCNQTNLQDHEAFINQLLVELDGFGKQDGVVLMATTSNIKQIDKALRRPGRMDRVFYLQSPTDEEREKILIKSANQTMDENLIDFVDWRKVAKKTSLLRPSELQLVPVALEGSAFRRKFLDAEELRGYCCLFATYSNVIPKWVRSSKLSKWLGRMLVNHLGLSLTKDDLESVVDLMEPYGKLSNGMELMNPPINWTWETKFPHAVWAAGRCLIALLLPNYAVVDALWLEPSSWEGIGCTKMSKVKKEEITNQNLASRSSLEKKLVFCFGSYVASRLLLPIEQENLLSAAELKQAQEIATTMVIQYGWDPDEDTAVYHTKGAMKSFRMGKKKQLEIADKVARLYDLAFLKAREMLQKNRAILERIVEELLEFEILTGKDLDRVLQESGGMREKEPFSLSNATTYGEAVSSAYLDG